MLVRVSKWDTTNQCLNILYTLFKQNSQKTKKNQKKNPRKQSQWLSTGHTIWIISDDWEYGAETPQKRTTIAKKEENTILGVYHFNNILPIFFPLQFQSYLFSSHSLRLEALYI